MEIPWKVVFAFIGVFIAGSVFGGFFALRIEPQVRPRDIPRPMAAQAPLAPRGTQPQVQLLRRFAERLELSEEQREKIRPIVAGAEEEIGRVRQATLEQTQVILRKVQENFRAELTPEQRRKLERMQSAQTEVLRKERIRRQQEQQHRNGAGQQGLPNRSNQRPSLPPPPDN